MASAVNVRAVAYLANAGDPAKTVLAKVKSKSAISGWELSKSLQMNPDEVTSTLSELRQNQLVDGDGEGLEGIYHLTEQGYLSSSMF